MSYYIQAEAKQEGEFLSILADVGLVQNHLVVTEIIELYRLTSKQTTPMVADDW
ncbi:hypothetical protein [Candidatus Thiosymbion oneisti]|uniref:hypothetical protein n=1 Tax=Candidatus Thiosymbion oneisti TaxID=589554 RepID=UPI0015B6ADAF|nr:hypothetical protein [Candidatus Thiosymbion oneisti]